MPVPLALQAVGAAIADQAVGSMNDGRQYALTARQQALQIKGQKEMTDYNADKSLAMWKATGPVGMSKELGAAGLNKALMYGGTGAGGQSSNITGGNVSGGGGSQAAPMDTMGLLLMKAQKENIEASTEKTKAETGVSNATVPKLEAETKGIYAGITNTEAKTKLTEIEQRTAKMEAMVAEESVWDAIAQVQYNMMRTKEEVNELVTTNKIKRDSMDEVIKSFKLQNAETIANIGLKAAQQSNTYQMTTESKARILQWVKENVMRQQQISNEGRRTTVEELEQSVDKTFKEALIEQGQWHNFIQGMNGVINMGSPVKGNKGVGKPF